MPGNTKKEGEWGVRDKNARSLAADNSGTIVPRVHEPRPGFLVGLTFDKPFFMKEQDARVFLKSDAFVVTDENDNVVPPMSENAMMRRAPDMLPPNMVVADVHELTDEALLTRVAQVAGGSNFTSATPRELMIRFLIDEATLAGSARGPVLSGGGGDASGDIEDMDDDGEAARRLLEGA